MFCIAITTLDEVFQGKKSKSKHYLEALRKNEVPGLLYLILFLHDLGKDQGPKGHCERGVEIARGLMDRLGISDEMHDRILFVIRNHLEMSGMLTNLTWRIPRLLILLPNLLKESNDYAFSMFTPFAMQTLPLLTYGTTIKKNSTLNSLYNTLNVLEGKHARKDPSVLKNAYTEIEVEGVPQRRTYRTS